MGFEDEVVEEQLRKRRTFVDPAICARIPAATGWRIPCTRRKWISVSLMRRRGRRRELTMPSSVLPRTTITCKEGQLDEDDVAVVVTREVVFSGAATASSAMRRTRSVESKMRASMAESGGGAEREWVR